MVSENEGRGIYINDYDQNNVLGDGVTVRDSLISKNRQGGVYINGYGHQVLDSEISQNSGSDWNQSGMTFDYNTSKGSGFQCPLSGQYEFLSYGSAGLIGNTMGRKLLPFQPNITIEKSRFLENRNSSNDQRSAGAIFIGRTKGVTISESKFADNQGGGAGAIMFQNAPENRIVASTFSANKGDLAGAVYFRWRSKDNRIERSNLVGHGSLAVNADVDSQPETEEYTPFTSSGNVIDNSFIAGNNGAGDGVVDASSGTTSTAEPAQWKNVEVSNPRSETHGDAPRPPLQLKDIKVSANASEASATISWNTEVQSDSDIVYGTAAPQNGAEEWNLHRGNGHYYLYVLTEPGEAKRHAEELGGYLATHKIRKKIHW